MPNRDAGRPPAPVPAADPRPLPPPAAATIPDLAAATIADLGDIDALEGAAGLTLDGLAACVAAGACEAWLLTETAEPFFARDGWARADRGDAPPAVAASVEFTSACPATAVAMRRRL